MSFEGTATRTAARAPIRLGLWGPRGSGKTTYLAALKVAVNRMAGDLSWIMHGVDDASAEWLTRMTHTLVDEQRFPPATQFSKSMTFQFNGTVMAPAAQRGWFPRRPPLEKVPVRFDLDVFDPPGRLYQYTPTAPPAPDLPDYDTDPARPPEPRTDPMQEEEQLLEHLEECQGVIFLFDPVRDAQHADAFQSFHGMMDKLAQRWFARPQRDGVKLPHYFAVCVTKFDDQSIYRKARRYGLTETDDLLPFMPQVPDQCAEPFFRQLCHESRGNADLVMNGIDSYLDPQRVRYFVTSAIGLYVGPDRRFRPHDPVNVAAGNNGQVGVRGHVYPMNVFEPLLWLEECIRTQGSQRWVS